MNYYFDKYLQDIVAKAFSLTFCYSSVVSRDFAQYNRTSRKLLCRAKHYGNLMQVNADSFLPNQRFNLAMGLAAIHVGQHLRKSWMAGKKSG